MLYLARNRGLEDSCDHDTLGSSTGFYMADRSGSKPREQVRMSKNSSVESLKLVAAKTKSSETKNECLDRESRRVKRRANLARRTKDFDELRQCNKDDVMIKATYSQVSSAARLSEFILKEDITDSEPASPCRLTLDGDKAGRNSSAGWKNELLARLCGLMDDDVSDERGEHHHTEPVVIEFETTFFESDSMNCFGTEATEEATFSKPLLSRINEEGSEAE